MLLAMLTCCRYLGALSAIEDPDYLTAFGSILGVEARQSSYIRAGLGEAPFPNPFDTPLDFVSLSSGHGGVDPDGWDRRTRLIHLLYLSSPISTAAR